MLWSPDAVAKELSPRKGQKLSRPGTSDMREFHPALASLNIWKKNQGRGKSEQPSELRHRGCSMGKKYNLKTRKENMKINLLI